MLLTRRQSEPARIRTQTIQGIPWQAASTHEKAFKHVAKFPQCFDIEPAGGTIDSSILGVMPLDLSFTMRCVVLVCCCVIATPSWAQTNPASLDNIYTATVQPLLKAYCFDCHAGDTTEADLDFALLSDGRSNRRSIPVWLRIRHVLTDRQMPPKEADQPTEAEWEVLNGWVNDFLRVEAQAHAGDPGPIVLRRLNNDEYRYVVQDLTGVDTLDPTREFPIDGAAGEGFTNTGSGQGMSPALLQKYFDSGKEVATHVSLLPNGLRFSQYTTRRDQTDELKSQIRQFYNRYTDEQGSYAADLQGVKFETNSGGRLPVREYLAALITNRAALADGGTSFTAIAKEKSLSEKYLTTLWAALTTPTNSFELHGLQTRWNRNDGPQLDDLATYISEHQERLWKFNTVGHVAPNGTPRKWIEPVDSAPTSHTFRIALPTDTLDRKTVAVRGESFGPSSEVIRLVRPRLEFTSTEGRPTPAPVLLRDIPSVVASLSTTVPAELDRTAAYLNALASPDAETIEQLTSSSPGEDRAEQRDGETESSSPLNAQLLASWSRLTGIGPAVSTNVPGRFANSVKAVSGYDAINGWGRHETPVILANRSEEPITFLTLTVPARGVTAHPSPTNAAVIAWQSPVEGQFNLTGLVADADDKCGNGASWTIEHRSRRSCTIVAEGTIDNGGRTEWSSEKPISVASGDVVAVLISPRDGNHSCDTTHVEFSAQQIGGDEHVWNLASDVVDRILQSNPLPDSFGNADVWHFAESNGDTTQPIAIVSDSTLAKWRAAVLAGQTEEAKRLAADVQALLSRDTDAGGADRQQRVELQSWTGPLNWLSIADRTQQNNGETFDKDGSVRVLPNEPLELHIPSKLSQQANFVAEVHVVSNEPAAASLTASIGGGESQTAFVIADHDASRDAAKRSADAFRDLFPIVLCYPQIVPVDEVVTLTLFHREDDHLKRLMLDEAETVEIDRLWNELEFVSQEPLQLVVALEQLEEFATQGGDPNARPFEYLREPVNNRAAEFRAAMKAAEPAHLRDVLAFAHRAWRRPLNAEEQQRLTGFYKQLRTTDVPHDEAISLTVARVLTAPAFLYKLEQPGSGDSAAPVSDLELASRLSFFLWSTAPDERLRSLAESGRLHDEAVLRSEIARMLGDDRVRRLSIQFACQWLHLRNFDINDDKNEALYPQFASLRSDMYEETVRFFEDLFRNNGSILDILTADHTFANAALANHYGLTVHGDSWQRVDNVQQHGRGGVLAMATVLASQSGASRTSPILRGNWIYETLLGEKLPKPPAGVPVLPETPPEGLTARQLIEQHSSEEACARCHLRIDPYGFALEQYDAIGRLRPTDADTATTLPTGERIDGIADLRTYLATERREDFVKQFTRKLLGYALGREVQLSDEPFLEDLQHRLAQSDYRFQTAVEAIVLSPQFQMIRGEDFQSDD